MENEPHGPPEPLGPVQCHAHSKRTGERCKQSVVQGASVCFYHGGAAPQVKRKAEERIMEMVDPALFHLSILVEEAETDSVKLAAIRDVLDRAGFGAKQIHQLQGPKGASLFSDLTQLRETMLGSLGDLPPDMRQKVAQRLMAADAE